MKRFPQIAVAVVLTVGAAQVAAAQLPGIPFGPVETGTGVNLSADFAQPNSDLGGGSAYGLTAGVGLKRFGISASVGGSEPDGLGDAAVTYAGRIGMRVIGGGLNPLSIGAQVSANSVTYALPGGDVTGTAIMPGAWIKFSPPLFPIKPWGQVYYLTGDNVTEEVRFVAGLNFNLLLGFGLHAGYDWGDSGSTWGVGAHFTFGVPGM